MGRHFSPVHGCPGRPVFLGLLRQHQDNLPRPWWLLLSSSVAVVLIVVSIYLTRTRTKTVVHDRSNIAAVLRVDGVENNDVIGYVAFTGSETVGYVTDVGNNPEIELVEKHPVTATGGWVSQ